MIELEERYLIVKLKYLHEEGEQYIRENYGHCIVDGIVVEKDWPEYDPTVNLILERAYEEASD